MLQKRYRFLGRRYELLETLTAILLLLPILAVLTFLFVLPVIQLVTLSFTNFSMTTGVQDFIGLNNYRYLFEDPLFFKSIYNTIVFSAVKLSADLVLSLLVAVALNTAMPMRRLLRITYFSPVVVPVVASALIWIWFYDPGIGPFNQILNIFGLPSSKWLHGEGTALMSVMVFSVWKGLGYNVVLFLAGLQNIPENYIEAARIDGANSVQIFRRIKLPLLSPTISFVIMMGIINTFKMFTEINVLTPTGGPQNSTVLMVVYIYRQALTNGKMGRASAAAIALFFIVFSLTLLQKRFSRKTVYYD